MTTIQEKAIQRLPQFKNALEGWLRNPGAVADWVKNYKNRPASICLVAARAMQMPEDQVGIMMLAQIYTELVTCQSEPSEEFVRVLQSYVFEVCCKNIGREWNTAEVAEHISNYHTKMILDRERTKSMPTWGAW